MFSTIDQILFNYLKRKYLSSLSEYSCPLEKSLSLSLILFLAFAAAAAATLQQQH